MQAGDIVICHSKGIIGAGIRWAQRRDRRKFYASADNLDKWWDYNHVAILSHQANGQWYIIQAEASGVTKDKTLESVAPGGSYEVLTLPAHVDREKFLEFANQQVGANYGYLSIVSCALDMALPDAVCLRKANTWICSGLVAGALWYAGFASSKFWPDLYTVTPADIGRAITFSV